MAEYMNVFITMSIKLLNIYLQIPILLLSAFLSVTFYTIFTFKQLIEKKDTFCQVGQASGHNGIYEQLIIIVVNQSLSLLSSDAVKQSLK